MRIGDTELPRLCVTVLLGLVVSKSGLVSATYESDLVWQGLKDDLSNGGFVWHDVSVEVGSRREDGHLFLLEPTSGVLQNGQLTAILGPSGSGKTTLLTSLAGLTSTSSGFVAQFSTETASNGQKKVELKPVSPHRIGYLRQQDDFFTFLTVQETLQLAAFLELPSLPHADRQSKIIQTAQQLGLASALDRTIGDPSMQLMAPNAGRRRHVTKRWKWLTATAAASSNRLSGGERRRLSVALELLTAKQLLLADEPTSGT